MAIIKVANIVEEARFGGPQARIVAVAEKLRGQAIETVIICPDEESERFYDEAVKRSVTIHPIGVCRLSRKPTEIVRYFLRFPKEVRGIFILLKKTNVDIVHCNSARQIKGVVAGFLAGKKVIWHLQDTWSPFVVRALFLPLAFMSDWFIAAGQRVRQYYLTTHGLCHKPVKIIQAPVDTCYFYPNAHNPDRKIKESSRMAVVSVGNINPAKAYESFIEAASYLRYMNPAASWWIVGQSISSQTEYCKKLVQQIERLSVENFYFYGSCKNVRAVLAAADIYVCSSAHEASPISVWEAMSMGKAIVSTDVGDVKRFIQDGVNGFIVPVGDPKAMASKIRLLAENQHLREEFGRKARDVACRELDLTITARRHAEVYRSCLYR